MLVCLGSLRRPGRAGLEIAGENSTQTKGFWNTPEAATNNFLAESNKSRTRAEGTNKRDGSAAQFHIGTARLAEPVAGSALPVSLSHAPFRKPGLDRTGKRGFWGGPLRGHQRKLKEDNKEFPKISHINAPRPRLSDIVSNVARWR